MSLFTVIFSHNLPTTGGPIAYHYSVVDEEDAQTAGDRCIAGLGGFGAIIAIIPGEHLPAFKGKHTFVWNDKIKYKTKEVCLPIYKKSTYSPSSK